MRVFDLNDRFIKKDTWVKKIRKAHDPETLANLLKERFEFPTRTGPHVRINEEECPSDIIDALIASSDDYKHKLTPAVGLLLFNLLHEKVKEEHDILRGVFSIIRNSKLLECNLLMTTWIWKKYSFVDSCNDGRWKNTYRDALMAYATIQEKDEEVEKWWLGLWQYDNSFWWGAAFFGLRNQNPVAAAQELKLLMNRELDKTSFMLAGMWNDVNARKHLERGIKNGLEENAGWAGRAFNMLLEKLDEGNKDAFILGLRDVAA